jgi:glycosyltransferase involved in cell wall biosynthesis
MLLALRKGESFVNRTFWRMPYVKRLMYLGTPDTFERIYVYLRSLKNACTYLPYQPKISVIIPVYKVKPEYFRETLLSIAFQTYDNWEACIVDDCSGMPELTQIVEEFRAAYPDRVKYSVNHVNSHISVTSNHCLDLATGEYCALLDHDDRLLPNSLAEMVRAINWHDQPDVLYSDERTVNDEGWAFNSPFYKPDWSPIMHLAMNYTTHLTVYRTSLVRQVGGFRKGFEGSQDHDLMLRMTEATAKPVVHVPLCLYQWRAHEASTASGVDAKPYAAVAGEKAVREACIRRGRPAEVTFEPETSHYRVKFELKTPLPKVSIIIPSKNSFDQINTCLASIFGRSTYPHFEVVLVDNGSTDQRCFDLYSRYEKERPSAFRVVRDPRPFNFAAQNRAGVEASSGDYLVFLNNDTEVLTPDWIEELLRVAQFPEIGAVGCKLLYPDGQIQHAGILGAGRDIAVHAGLKLERNHNLYCQMLNTLHEAIAVTAACLMVAKSKYLEVQGFDELYLQNGYGDVDFCLKLREQGYSNLFSPYAVLTHFESKSRKAGLEEFEKQTMVAKWGRTLVSDPYLNPNINYGEYYNVNLAKMPMDINWNMLDLGEMPLSGEALNLAKAWGRSEKGPRAP